MVGATIGKSMFFARWRTRDQAVSRRLRPNRVADPHLTHKGGDVGNEEVGHLQGRKVSAAVEFGETFEPVSLVDEAAALSKR
jgi:hypothetical protein